MRKKSTLDYIIVSQRWLQLIRHLLIDEEGWFDVGSDHNLLLWKFMTRKPEQVAKTYKEAKSQRTDKRKKPRDWRWNRKRSADWTSYRASIEDEMNDFAMEMVIDTREEWTAKKRFERF